MKKAPITLREAIVQRDVNSIRDLLDNKKASEIEFYNLLG